jgi:hypothetical protein
VVDLDTVLQDAFETMRLSTCLSWLTSSAVLLAMTSYAVAGTNSAEATSKMPLAKLGKNTVKLEVASTQAEVQRGLMFRTSMPEDAGMVFIFHPENAVQFWMFHTLIPLDMLFIKDGKILKICQNVPPCKSENPRGCPTYPTEGPIGVTEVLELNGGYVTRHGIKEGDQITFEFLNAPSGPAAATPSTTTAPSSSTPPPSAATKEKPEKPEK